ncbi:MAG: DoxX family protein [Candidatus Sumerlaeota bacterium]|nr:DoxX family protein [Candidatus Sumerlaeota bacterium]
MILTYLDRHRDMGLLLLRVGLGFMFMCHGLPKLMGGPNQWYEIGLAMGNLGIAAWPTFWGLMAALAEFGGGFLLMVGFFFRGALFLIIIDMIVALTFHLRHGDSFGTYSHPIEDGIVMISLFLIGPGKYALDSYIVKTLRIGTPEPGV